MKKEVTLSLKVINHNYFLIMTGGNAKYGNIFSLEELQNTVKVNIIKPFKINSKSLKTNEIEENNWDIELKENPTTHCPCPKWKDVAVSNDRINIQYKLKSNTFYRIFYDWEASHSINMIGKYPTLIKEFFWTNSVDNWEIYVAQNLARNTSIMVIQNTGAWRRCLLIHNYPFSLKLSFLIYIKIINKDENKNLVFFL